MYLYLMAYLKIPTRPGEIICLVPVALNTQQDGTVYMFMMMDAYTEHMYQAGVERGEDMEHVLKQVQLLLRNERFLDVMAESFTIVAAEYGEYREEIENLIGHLGGSLVVDEAYAASRLSGAIDTFVSFLSRERGR